MKRSIRVFLSQSKAAILFVVVVLFIFIFIFRGGFL